MGEAELVALKMKAWLAGLDAERAVVLAALNEAAPVAGVLAPAKEEPRRVAHRAPFRPSDRGVTDIDRAAGKKLAGTLGLVVVK